MENLAEFKTSNTMSQHVCQVHTLLGKYAMDPPIKVHKDNSMAMSTCNFNPYPECSSRACKYPLTPLWGLQMASNIAPAEHTFCSFATNTMQASCMRAGGPDSQTRPIKEACNTSTTAWTMYILQMLATASHWHAQRAKQATGGKSGKGLHGLWGGGYNPRKNRCCLIESIFLWGMPIPYGCYASGERYALPERCPYQSERTPPVTNRIAWHPDRLQAFLHCSCGQKSTACLPGTSY